MRTHKDLDVWKQGVALAKEIYEMTAGYPKEEMYGLAAQMRRSVVSIPSNIAEGAARQGNNGKMIQGLIRSVKARSNH